MLVDIAKPLQIPAILEGRQEEFGTFWKNTVKQDRTIRCKKQAGNAALGRIFDRKGSVDSGADIASIIGVVFCRRFGYNDGRLSRRWGCVRLRAVNVGSGQQDFE